MKHKVEGIFIKNTVARNAIIAGLGWTLACTILFVILNSNEVQFITSSLEVEARIAIQKDLIYRLWANEKGGVYAPVNQNTPPNPYLKHVPEQNITSPSGVQLTLVNPAYMTRQVQELASEYYHGKGHLTSLHPLSPQNAPDEWEKAALERLNSEAEVKGFDQIDGIDHFRLIKPFVAQSTCLKCHWNQGYQIGDLMGGISLAIPVSKYAFIHDQYTRYYWALGIFWIIGTLLIFLVFYRSHKNEKEKKALYEELAEREGFLDLVINKAPSAFLIADAQSRLIIRTNSKLADLTGIPETEIVGTDYSELFFAEDRVVDREETDRLLNGEIPSLTGETRIHHAGSEELWCKVNISATKNAKGNSMIIIILEDFTQRMKYDEAIIASEEKFVQLVNNMPIGVYVMDTSGKCLFVNPHWQQITGIPFDEALGDGWQAMVHPDDREASLVRWNNFLESKTGVRTEVRILDTNNNEKWADIYITVLTKRDGTPNGFVGTLSDITEKMVAKRDLEASQSKIQRIVATIPNGVYTVGLDGKIIEANPAFSRITGYSDEELKNMFVWDLMVPGEQKDSLPAYFELLRKTIITPEDYVCNDITKDGRTINVRIDWDYLLDASGKHIGYVSVLSDITDQIAAIEKLKESEEKYRTLIEQSPDAICMHKELKFIFANQRVCNIIGLNDPKELIGRNVMDFVHPDFKNIVESRLITMNAYNGLVPTIEEKFIKTDGSAIDVEVSSRPIRLNGDEIVQVIFRDISERKRIEQERATISRISWMFLNLSSIEEIFAAAQNILSDAFGISVVNIGIYDLANNRIQMISKDGSFDKKSFLCISGGTTCEYVKSTGKPLVVSDIEQRKEKMFDIAKQYKVRSYACVPLFSGSNFLGIFTLSDTRPNMPMPSKYFLEDFANHLTQVILRWQTENEMRMKDMSIENSISAIVMSDLDGRIKYANDSMLSLWNYDSRNDVVGLDFATLWDDRELFKEAFSMAKNNQVWVGELKAVTKYGDTFICQSAFCVILNHSTQEPMLINGSFLNITSELTAIHDMEETRERYLKLIDSAFEAIVFVKNGIIDYANPSFFKMVNLKKEQYFNTDIRFDAFITESASRDLAELEKKSKTDGHFQISHEFEITDIDGNIIEVEASISKMVASQGSSITLYIMRDISLRKRTERELIAAKDAAEQLSRSKSSFLASMSHEIRTPLNGILGFAQILSDESQDAETRETAQVIHRSGKRLLDTLNQILDISRIESNKYDLEMSDYPLAELIEEVVKLFDPMARQKGIVLRFNIVNSGIVARIDKKFFIGVVTNLLNNAVKFTDSGEVVVSLSREFSSGKWLANITVSDTGIGIHKDKIASVFDEFKQVSEGFGRNYEGTGLGLTLAKKFTELMGGTIDASSEYGVGSKFVLRFHTEINTDQVSIPNQLKIEK